MTHWLLLVLYFRAQNMKHKVGNRTLYELIGAENLEPKHTTRFFICIFLFCV